MIHPRWLYLITASGAFCATKVGVEQIGLLVERLQGTAEDCVDGSDGSCLSFNAAEFNSLFVAHYWSGALVAVFTGLLIRKFGIWTMSWITAGFSLTGIVLFTIGPYAKGHGAYVIMLISRVFYGPAYYIAIATAHQVKSHWFFGRELAVAFALYYVSARVATVFDFLVIGSLVENEGLQTTLWITGCISLLSPVLIIASGWIYKKHAFSQVEAHLVYDNLTGTKVDWTVFKQLSADVWVLGAFICIGCSLVTGFMSDCPKFLTELHNYSESLAGIVCGVIAEASLLAPLLGYVLDRWGGHSICNLLNVTILLIAYIGVTTSLSFSPIVLCILIAVNLLLATVSSWSSIPKVEKPETVGVALGLCIGCEGFSTGAMLLVTGAILNAPGQSINSVWHHFFVFQLIFAIIGWFLPVISIWLDSKHGWRLHRPIEPKSVLDEKTSLLKNSSQPSQILDARRSLRRESIFVGDQEYKPFPRERGLSVAMVEWP